MAVVTDATRRALDEKAAIQRKKEEEAEEKLRQRKAGFNSRIPDRTGPVRAIEPASTERLSERPKLALAGKDGARPTWRERQAAKEAAEATAVAGSSSAVPNTESTTDEVASSRKTGYVPPARRGVDSASAPSRGRLDTVVSSTGQDDSSTVEPNVKWRPGVRRDLGPDGSPAIDRLAPRALEGLRGGSAPRDASPADNVRPVSSSGDSPAFESRKPTPGKYVPVHMRNK